MQVERIYIGGWFQRTTLHLAEIYDFLKEGTSPLELNTGKLQELHKALELKSADLKVEKLEYVQVTTTTTGFDIQIFEDGLIILSLEAEAGTENIRARIDALTAYYEKKLSPAISFLFSLGAPIPKELANIKTIYPYFVVLKDAKKKDVLGLLQEFGEAEHFEIERPGASIYRGDKLYVISRTSVSAESIKRFIQEQVFIREFKGQLHRYLNLHRIIWERIAEVKEKGEIRGKDVVEAKGKVESYAKTINLIEARINQMGTYLNTRAAIAADDPLMKDLADVLQFKHETLADTLAYIKEIWLMTKNYVESAQTLFGAIQAKATETSVKNLTIITSMGVGATLIGLFAQTAPKFTMFGVAYFFILALIGWGADAVMKMVSGRRMYKIEESGIAKDIK